MPDKPLVTKGNIVIPEKEYRKIEEYTALCPVEIACLGYAKLDGRNVVVDEVFLVPQVISLSSVEFLDKGLPWAVKKAADEGRLDELRFVWHSHATHGAYFSATDKDMVEKVRKAGPIPWLANAILNKDGDTYGRLDYFDLKDSELGGFLKQVTMHLDVCIDAPPFEDVELRLQEIEEHCTKKSEVVKEKARKKHEEKKASKKVAGKEMVPYEQPKAHPSEDNITWPPKLTPEDWKLHNLAKQEKWECYISPDDIAYYWLAETREFMGAAPIPIDKRTGEYKLAIEPTVIDASDVDNEAESGEFVSLDEAEDQLLTQAINAGMLH